jgi:dTDP-4-dehydrorhamnose reductase
MIRKKVLVTGSNGLLGQKIIYSLIERKDIDLLASSKGLNRLITKSGYKYIDLDITRNE